LLAGVLLAGGTGTSLTSVAFAVQSRSGQFLVSGQAPNRANRVASVLATNSEFLELEPTLLVVSCERIRQAVARELGLTDSWKGRIHINLFPVGSPADPITIAAEQSRGEWNYRMQLPNVVERRRLMRGLLQVLLAEVANRNATGQSAELPAWLTVGLAEHLLASAGAELLFPPPRARGGGLPVRTLTVERPRDPLAAAREHLNKHLPCTLQELSWPTEQDFTGDTAETFRASAHLLVTELIQLKNGPACFRRWLRELPQHLNWQTAFLKAFHEHFGRLLDAEKWWALQTIYFTGRVATRSWPAAESLRKLDEAIHVPTQVRTAKGELPAAETVSLQTVIGEWSFDHQKMALGARVQQLELLRQRVLPDLFPLAENYRSLLAGYLQQRDKLGVELNKRKTARRDMERLTKETIRGLSMLDDRLQSYRRKQGESPTSPSLPSASVAK